MPDSSRKTRESSSIVYTYAGLFGWKSVRVLRPFRGMYHDVRRRLPYYWSDIRDALSDPCENFPDIFCQGCPIGVRYIADGNSILPAIAYTLDMYRRTGHFYGIKEALFSSALAAMMFSILGAQPLTIVGITGLISLFNYTIFDIIKLYKPAIYPEFMCWTGIWGTTFHRIFAIFNLCDYMRYVTDFSSESFAAYVGIIYCSELCASSPVDYADSNSQGSRGTGQ